MRGVHSARRLKAAVMRRLFGTVSHVVTTENVVALTFDDGPDPVFTPYLLELLAKYDARATLFMIGQQVTRLQGTGSRLVEQAAQAGHAIANHTYSHPCVPALTTSQRRTELLRCQAAIEPYASGLFRPPKGLQSFRSYRDTHALGLKPIGWSAHAEDWEPHSAETFADRLQAEITNGSIVLLHDRIEGPRVPKVADRSQMLKGLECFLQKNSGRFRYVTVPQLLASGKHGLTNWFIPTEEHWPRAARYL